MIEKVIFDHPESAKFFSHFIHRQGDMTHDIVADAESYQNPDKNFNSSMGTYKKMFVLGDTDSKYAKGLGTLTVYYDSNDNPIEFFDKYDFDMHGAQFRVYTGNYFYDKVIQLYKTEYGFSDRGFIGEWQTRGMESLNILGAGSVYNISYP